MTEHEDLIAEARRIAVLSPNSDAGICLTSLVAAFEKVTAERDAARRTMDDHECGEQAERAYKRAVKAEAERDDLRRALQATDDYRIADWQKLEAERDEAEAERDAADGKWVAVVEAREQDWRNAVRRAEKAEAERDAARELVKMREFEIDALGALIDAARAERDELAAVVYYLRLLTDGSDWNGGQIDDILNSAPPVALNHVKAEALREAADGYVWSGDGEQMHSATNVLSFLYTRADRIKKGEDQ